MLDAYLLILEVNGGGQDTVGGDAKLPSLS